MMEAIVVKKLRKATSFEVMRNNDHDGDNSGKGIKESYLI